VTALTTALLVVLLPLVAIAAPEAVPLPRGWIGTTSDWVRGFGIGFTILNLVILVPLMVAFLSFAHGLEGSTTVAACGSCHVMTPFVQDLQNVKSHTLAATHFKNRYILDHQAAEEGQETEQVEQEGDRASATRPARQTVRAERRRSQTPTSTAVAMAAPST
jgi:hypothetical protein